MGAGATAPVSPLPLLSSPTTIENAIEVLSSINTNCTTTEVVNLLADGLSIPASQASEALLYVMSQNKSSITSNNGELVLADVIDYMKSKRDELKSLHVSFVDPVHLITHFPLWAITPPSNNSTATSAAAAAAAAAASATNTPLHFYLSTNNVDMVNHVLSSINPAASSTFLTFLSNLDTDKYDPCVVSPIASFLLENKLRQRLDSQGDDPYVLSKIGNLAALKSFSDSNPNHDWIKVDEFDSTCLYYACHCGAYQSTDIVKYLLNKGDYSEDVLKRCKDNAINKSVVEVLEGRVAMKKERVERVSDEGMCLGGLFGDNPEATGDY
jgi:hypothetical protein